MKHLTDADAYQLSTMDFIYIYQHSDSIFHGLSWERKTISSISPC